MWWMWVPGMCLCHVIMLERREVMSVAAAVRCSTAAVPSTSRPSASAMLSFFLLFHV